MLSLKYIIIVISKVYDKSFSHKEISERRQLSVSVSAKDFRYGEHVFAATPHGTH